MAKASDNLVATQTFAAEVDGETVVVHAGTRVHASTPLAKAHVHLFARDEPHVEKLKSRAKRAA